MDNLTFIKDYLARYKKSLFENDISDKIIEMKEMLLEIKYLIFIPLLFFLIKISIADQVRDTKSKQETQYSKLTN